MLRVVSHLRPLLARASKKSATPETASLRFPPSPGGSAVPRLRESLRTATAPRPGAQASRPKQIGKNSSPIRDYIDRSTDRSPGPVRQSGNEEEAKPLTAPPRPPRLDRVDSHQRGDSLPPRTLHLPVIARPGRMDCTGASGNGFAASAKEPPHGKDESSRGLLFFSAVVVVGRSEQLDAKIDFFSVL